MKDPVEFHRAQTEILSEGGKALVLANGGGIIALLGFMASIWSDQNTKLVGAAVSAMGILALGMVFGMANYFFRYLTSVSAEKAIEGLPNRHGLLKGCEWSCVVIAFVCFLLAVFVLIQGARSAIGI